LLIDFILPFGLAVINFAVSEKNFQHNLKGLGAGVKP